MNLSKPNLLLPVELQVRELDSRLLLACVAARRGFQSIIGSRLEMNYFIPVFPRSIYLSKSTTSGSKNVFRNLRRLGHEIVAWDEEALVHLPAEAYFKRRLSPKAIKYVSHMLAWGEDNAELWRQYPEMPPSMPIHITGNPRGDLLRTEMRSLYDHEVQKIRQNYGEFILVNTNFNQVNAYYPDMNLLIPQANRDDPPALSRRTIGMGMSRAYAEGLSNHKQAIFQDFQRLIPTLDQAFPEHTIVVRPHPAENQQVYHDIAQTCRRVRVTNEGNVVPWLIAARVIIHNGCTTGVESYALGKPAISYRASIDPRFDEDFHRLPNLLSHECFDFEQLRQTLAHILQGNLTAANSDKRRAIMEHHLAALDGPLACERMVDVFETMAYDLMQKPPPAFSLKLKSRIKAAQKRILKRWRGFFPEKSQKRPELLRHYYPGIPLEELRTRIARFQEVLGDRQPLKIEPFYRQFYLIRR